MLYNMHIYITMDSEETQFYAQEHYEEHILIYI